jgi:lipoprotein NlpD
VKNLAVVIFVLWGLLGCSASGPRAPVSDLTLSKSNSNSHSKSLREVNSSVKKSNVYKVQAGDTLYAIAWQSGLDVETLVNYNNIKPPYIIHEGQTLNLNATKAKKTTAKSNRTSQIKDKKSPTQCTGQSCDKNQGKKLVEKKTKAYSADKVDLKTPPKAVNNKKTGDRKVTTWHWPAKGKLTKTFASSQLGMKGISLSNQRGTAIYAATSGEVVYAGSGLSGYGNLIIIKHNYDYLSAYAHNEKLLVSENSTIRAGQKIAIMGDSGTDSVHLHFEIRYRGKSVDPLRYLPKR